MSSNDATTLIMKALHSRNLAAPTKDGKNRQTLHDIADDYERGANKLIAKLEEGGLDEATVQRKRAEIHALTQQEADEIAKNGETEDNRQQLQELRAKTGKLMRELGDVPGA